MKKLLFTVLNFILLIACDKETVEFKYLEAIPVGCIDHKGAQAKGQQEFNRYHVSYTFSRGNLNTYNLTNTLII